MYIMGINAAFSRAAYPPPRIALAPSNGNPQHMFEDTTALSPATDPAYAHPYRRLFLASFSILFLELVLIRWVPSYLRMFVSFTNFILMPSLLGARLAFLTHLSAHHRP